MIEEDRGHPLEECCRELGRTGRIQDVDEDSGEVVGEGDVLSDESMKESDYLNRCYVQSSMEVCLQIQETMPEEDND